MIKETNPKDAVGIKKWRYFSTVPFTVVAEVGVALLEGARKYGRHNYRVTGVRASVYLDAAVGHMGQWYEGEDIDADSNLSHITKAIASLVILRDAMIQDKLVDDRPPKANLDKVRTEMQAVVDELFIKYPDPVPAFTQEGVDAEKVDNGEDMVDAFRYMLQSGHVDRELGNLGKPIGEFDEVVDTDDGFKVSGIVYKKCYCSHTEDSTVWKGAKCVICGGRKRKLKEGE